MFPDLKNKKRRKEIDRITEVVVVEPSRVNLALNLPRFRCVLLNVT